MLYIALVYRVNAEGSQIEYLGEPYDDIRRALSAAFHPEHFGHAVTPNGMGTIIHAVSKDGLQAFLHPGVVEDVVPQPTPVVLRARRDGEWVTRWYDEAMRQRYQGVDFAPPTT